MSGPNYAGEQGVPGTPGGFEELLKSIEEAVTYLEELPNRGDPEEELLQNLKALLKDYYDSENNL